MVGHTRNIDINTTISVNININININTIRILETVPTGKKLSFVASTGTD